MNNSLDTSISTISEEQFSELFTEVSTTNPSADNLIGGKEPVKKVKENEVVRVGQNPDDVERIDDLDAFLNETDNTDDAGKDDKKIPAAPDNKDDKKDDKDTKDDKKDDKDDKSDDNKTDDADDEKEAVRGVLKGTVEYLVKKGIWLDFDGREDLEIDEDIYADLVAKQDEVRLQNMFSELVDSTGPYGKAIINFVKSGGNPDEVIDLFKEQKQIENFDTTSEDGKRSFISKYYKEVLNWKPEKVERHIKSLLANDELETETGEIKDLYDDFNKKELARITAEQAEYVESQKRREDTFRQNITQAISSRKDLTDKERKTIESSVLTYKNKLPDGNLVSDFYIKFAEIQANPQEYVDLIQYVMNKPSYIEKLKKDINNKAVDKSFNFIKGNVALSSKKGSGYEDIKRKNNDIATFDFGISKNK